MMAIRRYSKEDLLHLRESPLVQRPEDLPAIEQWIDESQQAPHTTTRRQAQSSKTGGDASPMGNFSTGVRPGLMARSTASKSGEDISLGPPRTMFPSSRNTAKVSDFGDKAAATTGDATPGDEQDAPRSRIFGGDRPSRKNTGEKESRDNRESWTSARERRALGGEDEEGRFSRREKDQDGERRNGFGDKHDGRWSERRPNGDRQGGWREREREKKERVWERGAPAEKEPEWMEDTTPAGGEDDLSMMGMPRNQEQFQKWKEAMSGKKAQNDEPENAQPEPASPPAPPNDAAPAKVTAPLKLEGISDKPFGGWAEGKSSEGSTPAKSGPGKGKTSRFASMFKDTQVKEETPPGETTEQRTLNEGANGSAEDAAGFQRILQMLGDTGVSQPSPPEALPSPPRKSNSNGTKPKSRFTGFFDQTPKSPERMQSPPQEAFNPTNGDMFQENRVLSEEPYSMFGGRPPDIQTGDNYMREQVHSNPISPEPMPPPMNGNREQHQPPARMNDIFLEDPPSRGAATPDVNIQNLLASQRAQRTQGQDKNSEFLLNLLQTKNSRPPSEHVRPDGNFPLWLDQPPNMPEPHAPKPRAAPPPPGLFEDQLLRNAPPPEQPRQDQPMPGNDMLQRHNSQRAPPGFFDEQSLFMQQQHHAQQQHAAQQAAQRRTFTEPPQQHPMQQPGRRMSGHPNLPQMQMPPPHQHPHQQYPGPPPEYLQSPGGQAPPPGFHPQMPRHAPGFQNIPNIFQPPQQQRGDMPGFPGSGMPGGPGNGMASPPNAPPGFYGAPQGMPPPGFIAPGIPMRGGGRGYDGGFDGGMGGGRR